MICHRFFFETFYHYGTQYLNKGNVGQFPQKSSFSATGKFGPKLCNLMSQAIRSYDMLSEKFEIFYYDGIQYLDQSNVCQFTPKIPSTEGKLIPFEPKLSNLIFDDSLSENFFEILWHFWTQYIDKSNISQYSFWDYMGLVWTKITLLTALEIFRNILA